VNSGNTGITLHTLYGALHVSTASRAAVLTWWARRVEQTFVTYHAQRASPHGQQGVRGPHQHAANALAALLLHICSTDD